MSDAWQDINGSFDDEAAPEPEPERVRRVTSAGGFWASPEECEMYESVVRRWPPPRGRMDAKTTIEYCARVVEQVELLAQQRSR